MRTDVVMPQMGESIAEGTIARWLKKVGDTVDRDEPLFEISTDKVDAEIPAPAAGVLATILVAEGDTAAVNSVVATIEGASGATVLPLSPAVRPAGGSPDPALDVAQSEGRGRARARATAVARRVAREHRIELTTVAGTGGAGRVTKHDVLRRLSGTPAAAPPVEVPAGARQQGGASGLVDIVPMTVMRRKIAEHMIASRRTSAHVYSVFEVDCARVEALRRARKAEFERAGAKLSILPFVIKAAADALRAWPILNASLDGDAVVYHGDVHVGIAVALDAGLIVPVIKHADRSSLLDIARAVGDLAARARTKTLKPEEVAGGTFTVTNPGNFGGTFATPIINQPQVAILELGTVEKRAVVVDDTIAIRPMMHITLGFDHRLIDGVIADQFLSTVKRTLETWDR